MSDLPENWIETEIGGLCSLKNGRAFKPNEWQTSGLPIVRIQNLNNPASAFNHFQGEVDERNRLRGGELLFAWSGTPGTSFGAHVWRGGEAVLNQHIFRVDFDEALLDKRFFRSAINQKLSELIDVAHGGVGLRHVTKGVFEKTLVALPPRPEQTRIANQLDTLLTRVQTCNDRFDAVPALLKRFRQTVLDAALNGAFLDGAAVAEPELTKVSISTIASVGTGSTPLRSNSQFFACSGTPWITSSATSAAVVTNANEFVTPAAISAHRLKLFPEGTLLVAMYGEGKTRGQVAELGMKATINQACAAVVVNESKAIRAYVKLALQANYLNMRELAEGGNQPNLNLSKVKEFEIPLPSLADQAEIVRRVEALFALADRIEARCTAARAQAQRLTPLVLAKAFRGELMPQDPTDEPASTLLARIASSNTAVAGKNMQKVPVTRKERAQEAINL
jgi:type I restriction enzyme S subunit